MRETYTNALTSFLKDRVPVEKATAQLWDTQRDTKLNGTDRVLLRVMLDGFYPVGAIHSYSVRPVASELRLSIGTAHQLTYIGR